MKEALGKLIISFLQRKMIYLIYSCIIEKWVILTFYIDMIILSDNLLKVLIYKDVLAIILFGIVEFGKVRISVGKNI